MDVSMNVTITLISLLLFLTDKVKCENLTCFSCHDTGNNRNCWDEQYLKSSVDYRRSCNATLNETYCLIEQFIQYGKVNSLIRDCNNYVDFSAEKKGRLRNIYPHNVTVCSFQNSYLVCISLCRESYCNGPLESNPNSAALNINKVIIVGLFLVSKICL